MSLVAGMSRMIMSNLFGMHALNFLQNVFENSGNSHMIIFYTKCVEKLIILYKNLPFPRQFQLYHAHTKELRQYS